MTTPNLLDPEVGRGTISDNKQPGGSKTRADTLRRRQSAGEETDSEDDAGDKSTLSEPHDESFVSTGSIVYHPEAGATTGDSSFDSIDLHSQRTGGASAESSFEIVGSGKEEKASPPSLHPGGSSEHSRIRTPQGTLFDALASTEQLTNEHDDSLHGLLNPEAPTFDFASAQPHTLVFPPGTTFNEIVLLGKDENGDLTPDARAALHDLGLKLIPAMHGPLTLPYARCPSGIDAFLTSAGLEEEDPHPFIVDPTAPLPRPLGAALPLPGNSRFAHHNTARGAPRAVSSPAALEAHSMRMRNVSGGATGSRAAPPGPLTGSRRKPAPAFPNAPRTAAPPTAAQPLPDRNQQAAWVQHAQQAYQTHLAQQAHLAHQVHQARLAQQQQAMQYAQMHLNQPYSLQPTVSSYGTTAANRSHTSPVTPLVSPQQYLYPQAMSQPYPVVPGSAAALASQILGEPSAFAQSRRNSVLAAAATGIPLPAGFEQVVDSLTLLQLASKQQEQRDLDARLGIAGGQGGGGSAASSRNVSYETAPDVEAASEDDDEGAFDPSLNVDSNAPDTANEGAFFYPPLGPGAPPTDYLHRRRKSAAPSIPQPGGRRMSLAPAVDVGPRRASIAPQARLAKEDDVSTRPSHSRSHTTTSASRKPSVTFQRQASQQNLGGNPGSTGGGGGGNNKPRVFSDVGNTVSHPPRRPAKPVRHASDSAANWRRRPTVIETPPTPAQDSKTKGKEKAAVSSAASAVAAAELVSPPSEAESWNLIERVAQELLAPSTSSQGRSAASTSGETTPRTPNPPQQQQQQASSSNAIGGEGGQSKPKRRGYGRGRGGGRGRGRGMPSAPVVTSSSAV